MQIQYRQETKISRLIFFEGIWAGRTFVFSFEVSKKFFVLDKAPILMMILLSMAFVTS